MSKDGVTFKFESKALKVEVLEDTKPFPKIQVTFENNGETKTIVVEALLIAAGRAPNVENMGLDVAGVSYNP